MRPVYDFHGGIHPPENKQQSTARPIRFAGLPERLIIPLQQHAGAPAKPLVSPGQRVLKGELIGEPEGKISAAIHAPTSGTIDSIALLPVAHPSGMSDWCITLIPDGKDTWAPRQPIEDFRQLEREELLERVRYAGIVGLGGGGFPTEIKLHPPLHDKVETLILNGAECEPYITADDMLMRERAEEIVRGMEIMAFILRPQTCLIGIEDNKPEAIAALRKAVEGTRIEVVVVPTKYPSGGEKQLVKLLTDIEIPHGHIPADVGVMCQNVGTALAVYRAIRHGEPLISRITTLTGDALAEPGNFETLIGTPVRYLLEQAGVDYRATRRLIKGGPMMGFALETTDVPVVKTTNCLIAATAEEFPDPAPEQPCIRCGQCAEACPMDLLPQQLFWFARAQEFDKAEHFNLFDCIECGACAYVCPSSIPLVQYYRYAKGEIREHLADTLKSDRARQRFEARQARLEREQAEKEAKRKARAEAAAKAQAEKAQAPVDDRAAKAAAVQAALARKGIATPATPAATAPDPTELQAQLDKARDKLAKMQQALDDARDSNPDQVEKLERAVAKNQERVQQAEQALQAAQPTATPAPNTQPDLTELQTQLDKARDKLAKMQQVLDDARSSNPAQVEKLERAVAKNQERVTHAEAALNAAQAPATSATAAEVPDLATLRDQLDKARNKLTKMEQALADADAPEQVEKLQRAVAKNRERVALAEQALEQAESTATSE